jgi:hypothetical protein
MSRGFEMMRCCIRWCAHLSAAASAESWSPFLRPAEPDEGASIDGDTSMARRIASF